MSLDTLYKQILLSEQQLSEQTHKLKDVKMAIISYKEQIKSTTEKYEKTNEELDEKTQQVSVMKLQHDLMKKHENQLSKQVDDLLSLKSYLGEQLTAIKKESTEEEEHFFRDISKFNSDFSLRGNRERVFERQTRSDILDLEREVESLYKEMELMSRGNSHMSSLLEEKRMLQLGLQDLEDTQRDLDQQLSAAEMTSVSLRADSLHVSQKPLADSTCLRLRKELEKHKTGELELLREALTSEIQLMQTASAFTQTN